MTPLKVKPLRRQIPHPIGRDVYIVELTDAGLAVRVKCRRKRWPLPWGTVIRRAAEVAADEIRKQRAEKRRARRGR